MANRASLREKSTSGSVGRFESSWNGRARHLLALAQADVDERWSYYEQLAGVSRSVPQDRGNADVPTTDTDTGTDTDEDLP